MNLFRAVLISTLSFVLFNGQIEKSALAGDAVEPKIWPYYREYLKKPNFKAFAAAGGWQGSVRGTGWTYGYSSARDTAQAAIDSAMWSCENTRRKNQIDSLCKLFAIGDVRVSSMNDGELARIIALYNSNFQIKESDLEK